MPTVTGPDFLALQVRDLERAASFYEQRLGLRRAPASPPGAVVFVTEPVAFAVRDPLPGTDLDAGQPGLGVALWMGADEAQPLHDRLAADGVEIVQAPFDGPFGGCSCCAIRTGMPSRSTTRADGLDSGDPIEDLRTGWDLHVGFGVENPAL